ncbi:MAG TPA: protein kinase [Polyangiaceae bacterium]
MEGRAGAKLEGAVVAGKYRVKRVVGAGSMGVVCEAQHLEIGKRLAIKLIDASLAGMSEIALRFRQEARAASLVESQHIVQVFDVGTDDKLGLYLVMEYLTGRDLAKLLSERKRLIADEAVRIGLQVARGLAKAHEAGVVHRDLKPANIFLADREDDQPLVKILDFGISKVIDASRAESKLKLTRAGTVVGTPQYMSPEQAQGYSVDARTDVWALGLVLYEMLAGRPAYPEMATYEQFIIHLVSNPPDPLGEVAPWVEPALARVVHRAIEHDVKARIQNCVELARELLEAHPLAGVRPSALSTAEMADTWADEGVRSPYASDPGAAEALAKGLTEPPPPARTTDRKIATRAEDSLEIEVDVSESGTPPPPRVAPSVVARSGVREPAEAPSEDLTEDAPQFFDREAIKRMSTPPPPGPTSSPPSRPPVSAPEVQVVLPHAQKDMLSTTFKTRKPASGLQLFGLPIAWAALAFIAVGLIVAVALALR